MARVTVNKKNEVVIPAEVAASLGLQPGAELDVQVTKGGLWLRLAGCEPDQWWYWTPEWQRGEDEVEANLKAGLVGTRHESDEEFLVSLAARIRRD